MAKCLLPSEIAKIKQDFKDKNETFRPSDYMKLDGEEMVKKLEPIVGKNAKDFADLIQQKMVLKNRIRGLELLRDKINEKGKYSPARVARAKEEIARYKQKNLERVMSPKEHESFLSSLASQTVGTELSREQAKTIFEKSKVIEDLKLSSKNTPDGMSPELSKAQQELQQYINSLNEKPAWKVIRDAAANAFKNLYIGPKTGVKTAGLGSLNSALETIVRRSNGAKLGETKIDTKKDAVLRTLKLYGKTNEINILKTSLDDNSVFGTNKKGIKENFGNKQTIKEGTTPIDKALELGAKGAQKISGAIRYVAIDLFHKAPMAFNAALAGVDALDIHATNLAKTEFAKKAGMDAEAIFKDGYKVEPETELGKLARTQMQQEVFRILSINNTALSDLALKAQKGLNNIKIGGETVSKTFGDYIIPMAKVPSSGLSNLVENMGGGVGTGTYDLYKGYEDLKNLKSLGRENTIEGVQAVEKMRNGTKTLARTGLSLLAASLITYGLTKKDFHEDNYGNAYVHIGNNWISTVAFGPVGAVVAGIMSAKTGKHGDLPDYIGSGFKEISKAPAFADIPSDIQKASKGGVGVGVTGFTSQFTNPIFVQDIQKAIKQQTLNPVIVGSLIRSEKQFKQDEDAAQAKSVVSRKANAKFKSQGFFGPIKK